MSRSPLRRRLLTGAMALAVATGGTVVGAVQANAAVSTQFTVTAIAPKKLAALTANQVVTITGTGFDEANIASVDLGPCTDAVYIVQSATTLLAKTPDATCGVATASTTVPEDIVITDTAGDTVTFTGAAATGLFFVTAPSIASSDPVYTELSANLLAADKVKRLKTTGGQQIRIVAGAGYTFPTTANAVTGSLGGTALTAITVAAGGGSLTATAPARAAGAVNLTLSANGVAKTFPASAVGVTYWTPPTVTTVAPNAVKAVPDLGTGGNVVLTGTGFSATAASNTVEVCGEAATVSASTTTSITFATPDPNFTGTFEGVCPVTVTVGGNRSPVTSTSFLAYLVQ